MFTCVGMTDVLMKLCLLSFTEFPNCVGAIDGTHVPIIAPWVNPEQYYTYKKNFAINVQLVVNHKVQSLIYRAGGQEVFMTHEYCQRALCKTFWILMY